MATDRKVITAGNRMVVVLYGIFRGVCRSYRFHIVFIQSRVWTLGTFLLSFLGRKERPLCEFISFLQKNYKSMVTDFTLAVYDESVTYKSA